MEQQRTGTGQTQHPEPLTPADDGSARWALVPTQHERHANIYGTLSINVCVHERAERIGDSVYLYLDAVCASIKATLTPEDAEALGTALLAAAAQARDNASSQAFLDEMHERLLDPEGLPPGVIYVHPQVRYCHPDDFAAESKELPAGHTLIADELCERRADASTTIAQVAA